MTASADQRTFDFDPAGSGPPPAIQPIEFDRTASIRQKFEAFHAANPLVYMAIVSMARELRRQGFKSCGMKLIFEQLRYRHALATQGSLYKLNNIFTAEYARLVMELEPDLADFFHTRRLTRKQ